MAIPDWSAAVNETAFIGSNSVPNPIFERLLAQPILNLLTGVSRRRCLGGKGTRIRRSVTIAAAANLVLPSLKVKEVIPLLIIALSHVNLQYKSEKFVLRESFGFQGHDASKKWKS